MALGHGVPKATCGCWLGKALGWEPQHHNLRQYFRSATWLTSSEGRSHCSIPTLLPAPCKQTPPSMSTAQWVQFSLLEIFIDFTPFCKINIPTLSRACLLILPSRYSEKARNSSFSKILGRIFFQQSLRWASEQLNGHRNRTCFWK